MKNPDNENYVLNSDLDVTHAYGYTDDEGFAVSACGRRNNPGESMSGSIELYWLKHPEDESLSCVDCQRLVLAAQLERQRIEAST